MSSATANRYFKILRVGILSCFFVFLLSGWWRGHALQQDLRDALPNGFGLQAAPVEASIGAGPADAIAPSLSPTVPCVAAAPPSLPSPVLPLAPPPPPPFYVPLSRIPQLEDPNEAPLTIDPSLLPKSDPDKVPNIVHYVYGFKAPKPEREDGRGDILPYYAYLAVRSAIVNLKPDAIFVHYKYEPRGPFWEALRPHLTLIKTEMPTHVFGRHLEHFAHKADVTRLQVIRAYGGIYLDIDVFVLRPFTPLLTHDFVMGMEFWPGNNDRSSGPTGLCNAIIIGKPGQRFADRWMESYRDFDGTDWNAHSVRKPWEISRQHPTELTVLDERAFFWPLWGEEAIQDVHEGTAYDFDETGQLAYHTWESVAMGYLMKLTPDSLKESQTSFGRMAKKFVDNGDAEIYKAHAALLEAESSVDHGNSP